MLISLSSIFVITVALIPNFLKIEERKQKVLSFFFFLRPEVIKACLESSSMYEDELAGKKVNEEKPEEGEQHELKQELLHEDTNHINMQEGDEDRVPSSLSLGKQELCVEDIGVSLQED